MQWESNQRMSIFQVMKTMPILFDRYVDSDYDAYFVELIKRRSVGK